MANLYSQRTYDAATLLRAQSLIAATATEATVVTLGAGLIDADLVLDVTAIEVASTDESYRVMLQGSPDAAFTAGKSKLKFPKSKPSQISTMGNCKLSCKASKRIGKSLIFSE